MHDRAHASQSAGAVEGFQHQRKRVARAGGVDEPVGPHDVQEQPGNLVEHLPVVFLDACQMIT